MPTPEEIAEAMKVLGFDPDQTQTIVVTADSAIAISTAYPEPLDPPAETAQQEEMTNGE